MCRNIYVHARIYVFGGRIPPIRKSWKQHCSICEEFVDFVLLDTGTRGNVIADRILVTLGAYDIDINFIRGKGYDGAGNKARK